MTSKSDMEAKGSLQYVEDVHEKSEVSSYDQHDQSLQEEREAHRRLLWKLDKRIVPAAAMIYLLCYLDRSNIGNAKLLNEDVGDSLLQSLHLTNLQYVTALMVFLIAYALFEVPSNYCLKLIRPSRWIAFLMLSWGSLTIGMGGVRSFGSLTAVRFLLGAFEAGLFPGLVYFLTFWYRPEERSLRVALVLASSTLAGK
ncbi:hypothetical protein FRC12_011630 [Ceratobasidium sp. 428]|nr:hypothetical protein FRC12_011630 [Ceratobasidium sp. 428]